MIKKKRVRERGKKSTTHRPPKLKALKKARQKRIGEAFVEGHIGVYLSLQRTSPQWRLVSTWKLKISGGLKIAVV